jgi:hypothetical protein
VLLEHSSCCSQCTNLHQNARPQTALLTILHLPWTRNSQVHLPQSFPASKHTAGEPCNFPVPSCHRRSQRKSDAHTVNTWGLAAAAACTSQLPPAAAAAEAAAAAAAEAAAAAAAEAAVLSTNVCSQQLLGLTCINPLHNSTRLPLPPLLPLPPQLLQVYLMYPSILS